MGAQPKALLLSIAMPAETEMGWASDLLDGVQAEADLVGAAVVGGDTNSIEGPLVLCVTAIGELGDRAPVTRAGRGRATRLRWRGGKAGRRRG